VLKLSTAGTLIASWSNVAVVPPDLTGPSEVGVDDVGNVYVEEGLLGRIQKFSSTGKVVATWKNVIPKKYGVVSLAVDRGGSVYLGPPLLLAAPKRIEDSVEKLTGNGAFKWRVSVGGLVSGLAVDDRGVVYASVATSSIHTVIATLSPTGNRLSTLRPSEVVVVSMAIDSRGAIYAVNALNDGIVKISPSGSVVARWKLPVLLESREIAVDGQGYAYVTGSLGTIYKLSPRGKLVATWH
jgi:hypothetical protein